MMDYAGKTTMAAVRGMSKEELDYIISSEDANSIGALLLHIEAIEVGFQVESFMEEGQMIVKQLIGDRLIVWENKAGKRLRGTRWIFMI